jgi:hypothetical protein
LGEYLKRIDETRVSTEVVPEVGPEVVPDPTVVPEVVPEVVSETLVDASEPASEDVSGDITQLPIGPSSLLKRFSALDSMMCSLMYQVKSKDWRLIKTIQVHTPYLYPILYSFELKSHLRQTVVIKQSK